MLQCCEIIACVHSSLLHVFDSGGEDGHVFLVQHEWLSLSVVIRVIMPKRKCSINDSVRSKFPFIRRQGENV